jgi:hypothetical protein
MQSDTLRPESIIAQWFGKESQWSVKKKTILMAAIAVMNPVPAKASAVSASATT